MEQLAFDLSVSRDLRDAGAASALVNAGPAWHERAAKLAAAFFTHAGGNGALFESARDYAVACGLEQPPSPNAWGAVTLAMSKRGTIIRTGSYLKSEAVKSHARMQPVWRAAAC